jgi:hypothetical protein
MECFICLNDIDISNNIFYLSCCNNYTHYQCIKSWINHSKNHSNITKCPYCTKCNNDISNLLYENIDIIIEDNNYNNTNLQNNYLSLCYFIFITLMILFTVLFFPV